ncbi:MAG TPA: thioredoxin family protein [Bacteroidia bacterium]|nr:thioredoxin family protein [Bacteroidia bacterium]HRU68056.1 thioredoxin family protein [Bacteroidia bacterium]
MTFFNNNQFEPFSSEITEQFPLVLVEIYADWSGSCHIMSPVIKDLKNDLNGSLKICRVNFDTDKTLINKYHITKTPAYLIFNQGKMIEKIEGIIPRKTLVNKIKILIRNGKN